MRGPFLKEQLELWIASSHGFHLFFHLSPWIAPPKTCRDHHLGRSQLWRCGPFFRGGRRPRARAMDPSGQRAGLCRVECGRAADHLGRSGCWAKVRKVQYVEEIISWNGERKWGITAAEPPDRPRPRHRRGQAHRGPVLENTAQWSPVLGWKPRLQLKERSGRSWPKLMAPNLMDSDGTLQIVDIARFDT